MNKQNNQSDEKKKVILSILAVIVLVLMVIGVSYAVFTYVGNGTKENKISTGTLTFSYSEGSASINIVDAHPISDEVGKTIEAQDIKGAGSIAANPQGSSLSYAGVFDFEVAASMSSPQEINYEIYGTETSPMENKLENQYVKIYLTDQDSDSPASEKYQSSVPTYSTLDASTAEPETGKTLYMGSFSNTGSKKFRLRMWIGSDTGYVASGDSKTFAMKVNVKATGA